MSSTAYKRLRLELTKLEDDGDIKMRPNERDLRKWDAYVRGPFETPFQDGIFHLRVEVGNQYPMYPPSIRFVTPIFHPNINFDTGEVCLDVLSKSWTPAWGLQSALRAVLALLSDPVPDSPLNCDAGNMLRAGDALAFKSMARMYTRENALTEMPNI